MGTQAWAPACRSGAERVGRLGSSTHVGGRIIPCRRYTADSRSGSATLRPRREAHGGRVDRPATLTSRHGKTVFESLQIRRGAHPAVSVGIRSPVLRRVQLSVQTAEGVNPLRPTTARCRGWLTHGPRVRSGNQCLLRHLARPPPSSPECLCRIVFSPTDAD